MSTINTSAWKSGRIRGLWKPCYEEDGEPEYFDSPFEVTPRSGGHGLALKYPCVPDFELNIQERGLNRWRVLASRPGLPVEIRITRGVYTCRFHRVKGRFILTPHGEHLPTGISGGGPDNLAESQMSSLRVGLRVAVRGRVGTVVWNGMPEHRFAKVEWADDGSQSEVIEVSELLLLADHENADATSLGGADGSRRFFTISTNDVRMFLSEMGIDVSGFDMDPETEDDGGSITSDAQKQVVWQGVERNSKRARRSFLCSFEVEFHPSDALAIRTSQLCVS
mmetsp:Transcript_87475/g.199914  ORF Transcript_87475/g.199914 Transcript_87475/m.199914 type:complete len:280 (+) Transcript_87475:262-1101(+)